MSKLCVSEHFACRVLGQHRSTQRKMPKGRPEEAALTAHIVELATRYELYGYRRITALLHAAGWAVNLKRVKRIWRREVLQVPHKGRPCLGADVCNAACSKSHLRAGIPPIAESPHLEPRHQRDISLTVRTMRLAC